MNPAVAVILVLAVAWIGAHTLSRWLKTRFDMVTTGSEYLILGVLFGPLAFLGLDVHLIDQDTLRQLGPLMSLGVGWVGLLYGASLRPGELLDRASPAFKLGLVASLVTFLLVGGATWLALGLDFVPELTRSERVLAASVLGGVGTAGTPTILQTVIDRYHSQGAVTDTLVKTARLEEFLSIAGFGLVFCVFHSDASSFGRPVSSAEWYLISLLMGGVLGLLFRWFLRDEQAPDKQFLSLVGIIVFASGAAHYLELSPLLVNMSLGFVMLFNQEDATSERMLEILERTRQPMYIVLLLFAGAMWVGPQGWLGWAMAGAYIAVRLLARLASGWSAAVIIGGGGVRKDIGRGLLAQGEVAVAMTLSVLLVFPDHPLIGWISTALMASVLLNELWSARLLRGLLIDSGDIRHELPSVAAEDDAQAPDAFKEP